jgi:dephospho-CoA kinase
VRDELVARFGDQVAPGGQIDRSAVASLVFEQPDERKWLEGILWPRVGARVNEWRTEMSSHNPPPRALVVEVPLLFESGMEAVFDHTIAVVADEGLRSQRAAARGHAGVESRTARQLSQQEKAERAEYVVENDGDLRDLEHKLSALLANIGL